MTETMMLATTKEVPLSGGATAPSILAGLVSSPPRAQATVSSTNRAALSRSSVSTGLLRITLTRSLVRVMLHSSSRTVNW